MSPVSPVSVANLPSWSDRWGLPATAIRRVSARAGEDRLRHARVAASPSSVSRPAGNDLASNGRPRAQQGRQICVAIGSCVDLIDECLIRQPPEQTSHLLARRRPVQPVQAQLR